jgi:hypothetical protein
MSRNIFKMLDWWKPKQWPRWLAWAEYWYNTNYHASLKSTPFEALYGRVPPVLIRGDVSLSAVEEVNKLTAERNVMLREMLWKSTNSY